MIKYNLVTYCQLLLEEKDVIGLSSRRRGRRSATLFQKARILSSTRIDDDVGGGGATGETEGEGCVQCRCPTA